LIFMPAVYFTQEADRGVAYWHATDDAPGIFLCAIELGSYTDPQVCARFAELVAVAAAYRKSKFTAEVADPAARLAALPCATCENPEAADVLHLARQVADISELALSPSGYPIGCCKVHVVGAMGGRPDTPRSAVR
jgi:hypothetical protein